MLAIFKYTVYMYTFVEHLNSRYCDRSYYGYEKLSYLPYPNIRIFGQQHSTEIERELGQDEPWLC